MNSDFAAAKVNANRFVLLSSFGTQTTGPHNYAALQLDVVANMTGLAAPVDLCVNPEAICQDPRLKWVGALYYWTSVVQTDPCFNATLQSYADETGFHPCATVSGCLGFNRGTGGKINNGNWNAPAHGEAGRVAHFERIMAAIASAVNASTAPPTASTMSPTLAPATGSPTGRPTTRPTSLPSASTTAAPTTEAGNINFAELLRLSNLFYDAQRTGALPADVVARVPWRGNSFLADGLDVGRNLSGGFFDAGDMVKFGFPAASAMTLLGWSVVDFRSGYPAAELARMLSTLRWYADYVVRCHPSDTVLYGQVGDGDADHSVMCRPEECNPNRPTYTCSATAPCSDLAAETAAALSAIALAWQPTDAVFAAELIRHAESLYSFASRYRGRYHLSITDAATFYPSSADTDEMGWGAAWLYRATNNVSYLNAAEQIAGSIGYHGGEQSWDQKMPGLVAMLYGLTRRQTYVNSARAIPALILMHVTVIAGTSIWRHSS